MPDYLSSKEWINQKKLAEKRNGKKATRKTGIEPALVKLESEMKKKYGADVKKNIAVQKSRIQACVALLNKAMPYKDADGDKVVAAYVGEMIKAASKLQKDTMNATLD